MAGKGKKAKNNHSESSKAISKPKLTNKILQREIAKCKKSEVALKESEERFRLLSKLSLEGIVIHYRGVIVEANDTLASMFGYGSASELIGKSGFPMLTPESQKKLSEHLKTGSEEPYEATGIKKDGTQFPLEIRGRNTVYKGHPARVGTVYDLTERKKTTERYRTMIEYSNDMIWTLDREGRFTYFNRKAEEITGYKLDDWKGKTFEPLIVPEDLPKVRDIFNKTIAGKPSQYEVTIYGKEGNLITLSVNTSPIHEQGRVVGTVSFGRVKDKGG